MVGGKTANLDRKRAMIARDSRRWDYVIFVLSLALAGVFIYAGIDKVRDPLQFADSIAAFAILPKVSINPFALSLPLFEVACGLLLLWPWTRRVGALAVIVISAVFFIALSSALLRGLTLDCGCFGAGTPSRARMWLELGLDVVLAGASLLIYLRSIMASLATASVTWSQ
jgi:putative oxidoreductase